MKELSNLIISEGDSLSGLTFDADSFGNAKSYRMSYNIPDEEKLLVYAVTDKCKDRLTGYGTFITDEAIYIHPTKKSLANEPRIPLSDICSFLVYENKDCEVKLLGKECEYRIFANTKRRSNSVASELVKLLHSLQGNLMLRQDNRKTFENTVKRAYDLIRCELNKSGVLNDDFLKIISVMEDMPFIKQDAVILQLENAYRKCDEGAYRALLNKKKHLLNESTASALDNPDEVFFDSFINDILSLDGFKNVKAMIDIYLNLKAKNRLTLNEASVLSHICVKMDDYEYLDSLLKEVGEELYEKELWRLMAFRAKRKNHLIHTIAARVAGKEDIPEKELSITNDLGFSILHYTIMLRNKELLYHILPLCDWSEFKSPLPKDKMVNAMFDPMFLACNVFDDEKLLLEIYKAVSKQAKTLTRSLKGIDSMIDINTALMSKYPEHKNEYEDKLTEYNAMKKDVEDELKKLLWEEISRQKQMSKIIAEAGHPLCNHIGTLFLSVDNLISWLNSTMYEYRLNKYKNIYFVTQSGEDLGLPYCEFSSVFIKESSFNQPDESTKDRQKLFDNPVYKAKMEQERIRLKNEQKRREKFKEYLRSPAPYSGSWFSSKAHYDIRTLKEEYRVLVKKYHPDSSRDEKTSKILMRIMSERADILDRMSKKP